MACESVQANRSRWRNERRAQREGNKRASAKLIVQREPMHRSGCASETGIHLCNCVLASHARMRVERRAAVARRRSRRGE